MGTRSTIAIELADGTVEQVYCHWDGYLVHNGKILYTHYTDPAKVQALVNLGGFSSLCATVEATAETAYTRRGEELVKHEFASFADYAYNHQREEYAYILRNSGLWQVAIGDGKFIDLSGAFATTNETA